MSKKIDHAKNELLKTGKDFSFYLPTRIIPAILGFITIPIFTHKLGPDNYGVLALITTFTSLVVSISTNWLTSPIIRFFPNYLKKNKISLFSSTLSLLIFGFAISLALISFLVFLCLKSKLDQPVYIAFLIASAQIFVSSISQCYVAFFRASRQTKIYLGYSLIKTIFSSILSIIFVLIGFGVIGILLGEILSSLFVILVYLSKIKSFFKIKFLLFSKKIARQSMSFGLPLVISAFSIWILASSDRYMIKYFLDNSAVGIYSVPYNITQQSLLLIISSFVLASTPSLVNSWENYKNQTSDFLKYLNRLFIILILPLTILISILGKPIILLLAPADFLNGYKIMALVAFGVFFWGLYQLAYTGLYLKKKTWTIALNVFIAGILNIILNFFMIPKMGINGAALATLIAYFYIFISTIIIVKKILPWKLPEGSTIVKILFCATLSILPIWLILKLNLGAVWQILIGTIIYILSYAGLLFLTKSVYPAEKEFLVFKIKKALGKIF